MRLEHDPPGKGGMNRSLIDITRSIGLDSVTYPGDEPVQLSTTASKSGGVYSELSSIRASCHIGTHLDAPAHFIEGGRKLSDFPIDALVFDAEVIDATDAPYVAPAHLEGAAIKPGSALLFKTDNAGLSRSEFSTEFCYIGAEPARTLAQARVGLVGIDYLSVDPFDSPDYAVHRTLLGAGVLILEDVDLRRVEPGNYRLYCFPLKLHNTEAAPCRAVLELI